MIVLWIAKDVHLPYLLLSHFHLHRHRLRMQFHVDLLLFYVHPNPYLERLVAHPDLAI